jgi:hypothetical protein
MPIILYTHVDNLTCFQKSFAEPENEEVPVLIKMKILLTIKH